MIPRAGAREDPPTEQVTRDTLLEVEESAPDSRTSMRVRSSAWVFVAQVSKTALSIPIGILIARTLGSAGKGEVAVVQTAAAMTVVVLNLGMPNALMWLAAQGRSSARNALQLGSLFAAGAMLAVVAVALAVGPGRVAAVLGVSHAALPLIIVLAIAPSMLAYFADSYLIGRGVVRNTQLTDVSTLAAQLVLMLGLAAVGRLTVLSAVAVWLLCATGGVAWKARLALRGDVGPAHRLREVWAQGRAYGLKAWLGSTVNLLSLRQDVLLLAALGSTSAVGIYTVGVAAAELSWYVPNALQGVMTAKFSAEEDSLALAQRLNRSVWPMTVAFSAAVFVVAIPLIPLVYGPKFAASLVPLAILLPGIVATAMTTSLSAWLSGRGYPEDSATANAANMLVNLAANLLLIPRFGAAGAAAASSVSYAAGSAFIAWRFHHRTRTPLLDAVVPRYEDLRALAGIMFSMTTKRFRRDD